MPDEQTTARIAEAVDAAFAAEVGFVQDLVRFPSLRGAEAPAQDFMRDALRARGLPVGR